MCAVVFVRFSAELRFKLRLERRLCVEHGHITCHSPLSHPWNTTDFRPPENSPLLNYRRPTENVRAKWRRVWNAARALPPAAPPPRPPLMAFRRAPLAIALHPD